MQYRQMPYGPTFTLQCGTSVLSLCPIGIPVKLSYVSLHPIPIALVCVDGVCTDLTDFIRLCPVLRAVDISVPRMLSHLKCQYAICTKGPVFR